MSMEKQAGQPDSETSVKGDSGSRAGQKRGDGALALPCVASGFTPGPWKITGDAGHPANLRILSTARRHVAKVYAESTTRDPMAEANARLIAVAPDLLASHARLFDALVRMLASDERIATATEDELCEAANEPGDAELNEQAAAVLQCRAAIASIPESLK